jgi:hypothetical protein
MPRLLSAEDVELMKSQVSSLSKLKVSTRGSTGSAAAAMNVARTSLQVAKADGGEDGGSGDLAGAEAGSGTGLSSMVPFRSPSRWGIVRRWHGFWDWFLQRELAQVGSSHEGFLPRQKMTRKGPRMRVKQLGTISHRRKIALEQKSFGIFPVDSRFRQFCASIANSSAFEWFMVAIIFLSCFTVAADSGVLRRDYPEMADILKQTDILWLVLFVLEALIKSVAWGFVRNPTAYLRDGWDRLDFAIVLVSVFSAPFDVPVVRGLRALRPLRVLGRFQNTRLVIAALLNSVEFSFNVMLVTSVFWIIFGILSVQLFGEKLWYCTDSSVAGVEECTGTFTSSDVIQQVTLYPYSYEDPVEFEVERKWVSPPYRFDDIRWALLALFQTAILANWADIMYSCIDAVGVGIQPQEDYNMSASLFFIAWIIIGSFFALNIFIAAIVQAYEDMRMRYDGSVFLTREQQQWQMLQRIVLSAKPNRRPAQPPENSKWRRAIYSFVTHRFFERFIFLCIVGNIVVICLEHYDQPDYVRTIIDVGNWVFLGIFTVEAGLKIAAFGRRYFADGWNRFDFTIVVLGLVSAFLVSSVSGLRVLRLLRAVRLIKSVQQVLVALLDVLPKAWNVAMVLFVFFYIFAVLGVALLGDLQYGAYMNAQANFRDFFNAMLTLFRVATEDDWPFIMYDISNPLPGCCDLDDCSDFVCENPTPDGVCVCGSGINALYLVGFVLVLVFILLNLFVGIVLDSFRESRSMEGDPQMMRNWNRFGRMWAQLDPEGTELLPPRKVLSLLWALGPPLFIGVQSDEEMEERYREHLEVTRKLTQNAGRKGARASAVLTASTRAIGGDATENSEDVSLHNSTSSLPNPHLRAMSPTARALIELSQMDIRLTQEKQVEYVWVLRGLTKRAVSLSVSEGIAVVSETAKLEFTLADWYAVDLIQRNYLTVKKARDARKAAGLPPLASKQPAKAAPSSASTAVPASTPAPTTIPTVVADPDPVPDVPDLKPARSKRSSSGSTRARAVDKEKEKEKEGDSDGPSRQSSGGNLLVVRASKTGSRRSKGKSPRPTTTSLPTGLESPREGDAGEEEIAAALFSTPSGGRSESPVAGGAEGARSPRSPATKRRSKRGGGARTSTTPADGDA